MSHLFASSWFFISLRWNGTTVFLAGFSLGIIVLHLCILVWMFCIFCCWMLFYGTRASTYICALMNWGAFEELYIWVGARSVFHGLYLRICEDISFILAILEWNPWVMLKPAILFPTSVSMVPCTLQQCVRIPLSPIYVIFNGRFLIIAILVTVAPSSFLSGPIYVRICLLSAQFQSSKNLL